MREILTKDVRKTRDTHAPDGSPALVKAHFSARRGAKTPESNLCDSLGSPVIMDYPT